MNWPFSCTYYYTPDTQQVGRKTQRTAACKLAAGGGPKTTPMFINRQSAMSVTLGEACFNGNPFVTVIQEVRDGAEKTLKLGELPGRCNGSMIPLYVGGND